LSCVCVLGCLSAVDIVGLGMTSKRLLKQHGHIVQNELIRRICASWGHLPPQVMDACLRAIRVTFLTSSSIVKSLGAGWILNEKIGRVILSARPMISTLDMDKNGAVESILSETATSVAFTGQVSTALGG